MALFTQIKHLRILIVFHLSVIIYSFGYSQSLTGSTGLLRIPTANLSEDKTLIIGASFLNKHLLNYSGFQYDAIAAYATITFLPFLEMGIRYTRKIDMPRIEYETREFADRMPSFRLRVFKEREYTPALALGGNDFISSITGGPHYFASYYAVMTKTLFTKNENIGLEITLGHAFKIGNPHYYDLLGFFGGIRLVHPNYPWVSAMIDYDSRYWNTGFRFFLFKHLQIMPVLRNGKSFEGSLSYWIYL
ncbi:MAG: YjbH domain-containing protein [Bacteroidetes bacterium]|nr:YjbH domain-containing protein [Bacteroidota bacterium]